MIEKEFVLNGSRERPLADRICRTATAPSRRKGRTGRHGPSARHRLVGDDAGTDRLED